MSVLEDTNTSTEMMVEQVVPYNNDTDTQHRIEDLLSKNAYSDPITAVLRELANNGRDAQYGLYPEGDEPPIEIDLPTIENQHILTVTDHGGGMTCEETVRYHGGFWYSTKRGDA